MLLTIYRRGDARWIVMPSILRAPPGLRDEGVLQRIGRANLEFNRLTETLALGIALRGFGLAEVRDEQRLQDAMGPGDTPVDPAQL